MAKNTPKGKESEVIKKLKEEEKVTEEKNAARHEENVKAEAEKLAKAHDESDDQAPPVAVEKPLPTKERKAAWDKFVEAYAVANPVKYAAKKKAGHFDEIPDHFTGRDVLKNLQKQEMPR